MNKESEFKGDDYKQAQKDSKKELMMGMLYNKGFFDRGSKAAKKAARQNRLERRKLLREYKRENGGKRVTVT